MADQNSTTKTAIPSAPRQHDMIETIDQFNPIFNRKPHVTMLNIGSVLTVVKRFIDDEEIPGATEEESIGLGLILQCCIDATTAQCQLESLQQSEGGAA